MPAAVKEAKPDLAKALEEKAVALLEDMNGFNLNYMALKSNNWQRWKDEVANLVQGLRHLQKQG